MPARKGQKRTAADEAVGLEIEVFAQLHLAEERPTKRLRANKSAVVSCTRDAAVKDTAPAAEARADSPPTQQPSPPAAAEPAEAETPGNSLLALLHRERLARLGGEGALRAPVEQRAASAQPGSPSSSKPTTAAAARQPRILAPGASLGMTEPVSTALPVPRPVQLLTWNLWFEEDVELAARMRAVGEAVERAGYPELLCFQVGRQEVEAQTQRRACGECLCRVVRACWVLTTAASPVSRHAPQEATHNMVRGRGAARRRACGWTASR